MLHFSISNLLLVTLLQYEVNQPLPNSMVFIDVGLVLGNTCSKFVYAK